MEFLLIASAHFLALISPGPDFFLIMQAALRMQTRYAIAICCGIALANAIYLAFSLIGLELLRSIFWLFPLLKYFGAAYLIYLGFLLLKSSRQTEEKEDSGNILHSENLIHQFSLGFMSAILNPKNAIFYLSLFTVIVSDQTGLALRSLYALWMVFAVLTWDCAVVLFISRSRRGARMGNMVFLLEKLSGAMLAIFGVFLPFA